MTAALLFNARLETFAAFQERAHNARLEAFAIFREEARKIWRNAESVPLVLSNEEPGGDALASVACLVRPRSIGSVVLNPAATRTLRVSAKALAFPPEALRKLLIHEACHIGIGGHRAAFRALCFVHGGAMSGADATGAPVRLQVKAGARYRTVREFPRESLQEARAAMRECVRALGIRHRITY